MDPILLGKGVTDDIAVNLLPRFGNRHGLVAGATGTGKTVTLMTLAEGFSRIGVPVFVADVKGDVAGLAVAGDGNEKVRQRAADIGIMAKESNGRVHASSRAGAAGPMQFMPATGRRFGLGPDGTGFDTRFDPPAVGLASADYLDERMRSLNRNIEYALAAYNGGEGRAQRVFNQFGGRSFWDEAVYNQFPGETKDYVPMVIAAAWLYLHPKQYGLEFPKIDSQPATFRLAKASSIYELTICLGNGGTRDGYMRALRNLNPRYEADAWIPAGTTLKGTNKIANLYNRNCISGPRADLARTLIAANLNSAITRSPMPGSVAVGDVTQVEGEALMSAPVAAAEPKPAKPKAAAARSYRVARGDTLGKIAQKHDCDLKQLARANGLKAPAYSVRPGQSIKLEGCK